jgi:hypothetical protein
MTQNQSKYYCKYFGITAITKNLFSITAMMRLKTFIYLTLKEMKALIKHLLCNNINEILSKSFMNCHVIGLHSIMLLESAGKTIRLYITTPDHELWKNEFVDLNTMHPIPMPLGFHPHHCNLTLHGAYGNFSNWIIREGNKPSYLKSYECSQIQLRKYSYKSKISAGEIAFDFKGFSDMWWANDIRKISKGDTVTLLAKNIHTVTVNRGVVAAWFVYEGLEDETYESACYSNANEAEINKPNPMLYQKMFEWRLRELLHSVELI